MRRHHRAPALRNPRTALCVAEASPQESYSNMLTRRAACWRHAPHYRAQVAAFKGVRR